MRFLSSALATVVASSLSFVPLAQAEVLELDVTNFNPVLSAHNWTCILFYDHLDEENSPRYMGVMDKLEERMSDLSSEMAFARLSIRHHNFFSREYRGQDYVLGEGFYSEYSSCPNHPLTLTPNTFLNLQLGEIKLPARVLVFDNQGDVYGEQDFSINYVFVSDPFKSILLETYIRDLLQKEGKSILYTSTATRLKMKEEEYFETRDIDFDFEAYHAEQAAEDPEPEIDLEDIEDDQQSPTFASLRRLLEVGGSDDNLDSDSEDEDDGDFGHFVYKKADMEDDKGSSDHILSTLSNNIEEYLGWVEGYEVSWSSERRAREDEQTNFGEYLDQMNQELLDMFDRVLNKDHESREKLQSLMDRDPVFAARMEVPNLKAYLKDVIFGYARSPAMLKGVVLNITETLGSTPAERRRNRHKFDGSEFAFVRCLREYMDVNAKVDDDGKLYSMVLAELWTEWNNIMAKFHDNLNRHYLKYASKNLRKNQSQFQMKPMDVLDMEDPSNHDILTNYDAFHKKYTETGTPVILSNVKVAMHTIDVEYLASQCAAAEVTGNVMVSHQVGKHAPGHGWGGLAPFKLGDSLVRKQLEDDEDEGDNDGEVQDEEQGQQLEEDEDEDNRNEVDETDDVEDDDERSISMEQFSILYKEIDSLYLHDYTLTANCHRVLFDNNPYDVQQKFQMPSVIGSYDIFQRVTRSYYADSWPSLFVGRKGSNSKLHIDSGGTAFLMYLVSGRKRWIVYNRAERPFLYEHVQGYETYPDVLGISKSAATDEFLSKRFPLLHRAEEAFEIIQEPGQLVYIPPNCPHAVENLDDIVGLSMNFIPKEGVSMHLHNRLIGGDDFGAFQSALNYLLFEDNAQVPATSKDPLYTTFGEYKAQF